MRRWAWTVAGAVLAAILILGGLWYMRPDEADDRDRALASARRACSAVRTVLEHVLEDAEADRVLRTLDSAVASANTAADLDPRWRPLAGAVGALRVSIEEDDPGAARVGLSVVAPECRRAGVPISVPRTSAPKAD